MKTIPVEFKMNGVKKPITKKQQFKKTSKRTTDINEYVRNSFESKIKDYENVHWEGYSDFEKVKEAGGVNIDVPVIRIIFWFLISYRLKGDHWKNNFHSKSLWAYYEKIQEKLPMCIRNKYFISSYTSFNHALNKLWLLGLLNRDRTCPGTRYKNYCVAPIISKFGLEFFICYENKWLLGLPKKGLFTMEFYYELVNECNKFNL